MHVNIGITHARQPLRRLCRKFRAEFHGEDVPRQVAQHRCLIAQPRPDFKNSFVPVETRRRCHRGYDVWLRYRLAPADRQRGIFVSSISELCGHEFMAWDLFQVRQDAAIRYSPPPDLHFHHVLARFREVPRPATELAVGCHALTPERLRSRAFPRPSCEECPGFAPAQNHILPGDCRNAARSAHPPSVESPPLFPGPAIRGTLRKHGDNRSIPYPLVPRDFPVCSRSTPVPSRLRTDARSCAWISPGSPPCPPHSGSPVPAGKHTAPEYAVSRSDTGTNHRAHQFLPFRSRTAAGGRSTPSAPAAAGPANPRVHTGSPRPGPHTTTSKRRPRRNRLAIREHRSESHRPPGKCQGRHERRRGAHAR